MGDFTAEYVEMWKSWKEFDGFATVRDYWMAWLVNFIVVLVISILTIFVPVLNYVLAIYGLLLIIPMFSLFVRRMHDAGKSGWYWLWLFVPLIGEIIVFLALIKE